MVGSCTVFQLSTELGFPLYPKSNLTFSKCLEMGLQEYIEPIAKVAEIAGKEYSIEQVRALELNGHRRGRQGAGGTPPSNSGKYFFGQLSCKIREFC